MLKFSPKFFSLVLIVMNFQWQICSMFKYSLHPRSNHYKNHLRQFMCTTFQRKEVLLQDSYMWFSMCNQTYRRMIRHLYLISGLLWLNLSRDSCHFSYISKWMIINLATDRNFLQKRTLVLLGARSLLSFRRHVHGTIRCPPNTLGNFSKCLTPQGLAQ
jgi:hypothetical protein